VLGVFDATAAVTIVDRDRALQAPSWTLPGQPRDLRMDPQGRVVLVRPVQGESAWAVDMASGQVRSTLSTSWREDLPAVAPDGSVLVVLGPDLTRLDAATLQRAAVVPGGAADWWLVVTWDGLSAGAADALPPAFEGTTGAAPDALDSAIAAAESTASAPSSAPAAGAPGAGATRPPEDSTRDAPAPHDSASPLPVRWMVSFASLVDAGRAAAVAQQLRAGGTPARVVTAAGAQGTMVHRVVAGPFATREDAVRAGRAAGREHWIIQEP
jgi:hypothetical protein